MLAPGDRDDRQNSENIIGINTHCKRQCNACRECGPSLHNCVDIIWVLRWGIVKIEQISQFAGRQTHGQPVVQIIILDTAGQENPPISYVFSSASLYFVTTTFHLIRWPYVRRRTKPGSICLLTYTSGPLLLLNNTVTTNRDNHPPRLGSKEIASWWIQSCLRGLLTGYYLCLCATESDPSSTRVMAIAS